MSILDDVRANAGVIGRMGRDAIAASKTAGFPAYYEAPGDPGTMVRENPDGSLDMIPMSRPDDHPAFPIPGRR